MDACGDKRKRCQFRGPCEPGFARSALRRNKNRRSSSTDITVFLVSDQRIVLFFGTHSALVSDTAQQTCSPAGVSHVSATYSCLNNNVAVRWLGHGAETWT